MKRSEFCDRINPIQTFSVTFKSLKYARLASYLTPLSTAVPENPMDTRMTWKKIQLNKKKNLGSLQNACVFN